MTKKLVSFEPAHFKSYFERESSKKNLVIDGKEYDIDIFNSRDAARYGYHQGITRIVGNRELSYNSDEIRLAESLLENFFHSNKEYVLDNSGNTHQITFLRRLFISNEVEKFIVLPKEDQVRDILGLGYRAVKRGVVKGLMGIGTDRIERIGTKYEKCTDWTFPIAAGIIPSQIEKPINMESCGTVTIKLSRRGFRFSID